MVLQIAKMDFFEVIQVAFLALRSSNNETYKNFHREFFVPKIKPKIIFPERLLPPLQSKFLKSFTNELFRNFRRALFKLQKVRFQLGFQVEN